MSTLRLQLPLVWQNIGQEKMYRQCLNMQMATYAGNEVARRRRQRELRFLIDDEASIKSP
jgi:hypothetical protein